MRKFKFKSMNKIQEKIDIDKININVHSWGNWLLASLVLFFILVKFFHFIGSNSTYAASDIPTDLEAVLFPAKIFFLLKLNFF